MLTRSEVCAELAPDKPYAPAWLSSRLDLGASPLRYDMARPAKAACQATMTATHSKVIILGSGPAGCTAAIYAARAMLEPTLISGIQPGGQLTITTEVENYPGFAEAIQGPWLMDQMQEQAEHLGTKFVSDTIAKVDLSRRPFTLLGDSGEVYTCRHADHRHRRIRQLAGPAQRKQIPGLRRFGLRHLRRLFLPRQEGRGGRRRQYRRRGGAVPHQFRRQGDADPSPRLPARRQDQPDAPGRQQEDRRALRHRDRRSAGHRPSPKASPASRLRNTVTGSLHELAVRWPVRRHRPFAGHRACSRASWRWTTSGYIKTAPDSTHTSVAGVFAAGDVKDKVFRQAVTAAGMGCMAALEAERFLAGGTFG